MLRNLDTIYYKPDLVRISQPKLISARTFFWSTEEVKICKAVVTPKTAKKNGVTCAVVATSSE